MTHSMSSQQIIEHALIDKIAFFSGTASEAFFKLWHTADHDEQTGHTLRTLYAACNDLATSVKKYSPGTTDARNKAARIQGAWTRASHEPRLSTSLGTCFGDTNGTILTSQLKDIFAAGFAVMRGDAMALTLDHPPRPALPKPSAFQSLLSRPR